MYNYSAYQQNAPVSKSSRNRWIYLTNIILELYLKVYLMT